MKKITLFMIFTIISIHLTKFYSQTPVFDLEENFSSNVSSWGFTSSVGTQTQTYEATNKLLQVRWANGSSEHIKTLSTAITPGTDNKITVDFTIKTYTTANAGNYGALYLLDANGNAITGFHLRRGSVGGSNKWFVGRATSYPGSVTFSYPTSADPLNADQPTAHIKFILDFNTKTLSFSAQQGTFDYITRAFTASGASVSSENQGFINSAATNIKYLSSWYYRAATTSGTNGYDLMYAGISALRMVSTANVTVKYKDQNGDYFKADEVIADVVAGTTYSATTTQKSSFTDGTHYYVLNPASPISIPSVDGAGSTLELSFRKSAKFNTMIWNGTADTNADQWSEWFQNFKNGESATGAQSGAAIEFGSTAATKSVVLNDIFNVNNGSIAITSPDYSFSGNGAITGTGSLNVNLAATNALTLGITNNLTGTTQIAGGEITLAKSGVLGSAVTVTGNTTIIPNSNSISLPNITFNQSASITSGTLNSIIANGITAGNGVKVSLSSAYSYASKDERGLVFAGEGTLASGSELELNGLGVDTRIGMNTVSVNYLANTMLTLKGSAMFYINTNQGASTIINVGSLSGETNTKLGWGRSIALDRDITWSVGALNNDTEFAGSIVNTGGYSTSGASYEGNNTNLIKTGSGILKLSGTSTHRGYINVTAGTLEVTGSLGATVPVTVASGAILKGTGTIEGATIVNGTLMGSLNFGSNLTLTNNTELTVNGFATGEYDAVDVNAMLTNGGTLKVIVNAATPANNTTIQLLKAGTYTGTFAVKDLPEHYSFDDATGNLTYNNLSTGLEQSSSLKIYPVLTSGEIFVTGAEVLMVEVCNMTGNVLHKTNGNTTSNVINISNLSSGAYILRVTLANGETKIQKVLLNK